MRQQAANVVGLVGDADKGLPALNEAYKSEKDVNTKGCIDFARAQLKARLGVKEASAPAVSTPTATGTKAKPKAKKKKTAPKPAAAAP